MPAVPRPTSEPARGPQGLVACAEHFFETGPEPDDDKLAGRLPPDFDVKCHETSLENDRRQRFCERGRLTASGPVWCSISASSLAPSRTTVIEIQIQVMNPMIAPSEP